MKSFKHFNARTVAEAVQILKAFEGHAVLNAGGTDLLGALKDRFLPTYPEAVINIKTISGIDYVEEDAEGLRIGAMATLASIARSTVIKERYSVLAEAAGAVATPQIRNVATLGGNLCQDVRCWYYRYPHHVGGRILCLRKGSGPCQAVTGDNRYHAIIEGKRCFAVCPSDTAIALAALDAHIRITGPAGARSVPILDFFKTLGNVLKPDEMVTEIQIPRPADGNRQRFIKLTLRKPIDFAVVSVASIMMVENGICRGARIALGAIAPTPIRATKAEQEIVGKPIDAQTAAAAADVAVAAAKPLSMNGYKAVQARALVQRAILA
ncbi:MAG: FAD binding domain-containing protein [Chloroflexi bacterium]|nr:FAD binding domain-containing protein [Chloroflexota bacterium]